MGEPTENPTDAAGMQPAWSPYEVWRTQILEPRKQRAASLAAHIRVPQRQTPLASMPAQPAHPLQLP